MSEQYEIIKFTELNKNYDFVLTFDKPQEYANERYGGTTICYGANYKGKEVRFYASPGLHEEIQKQGLKKNSDCVVQKTKPNDFPYFIVNGKSKHLDKNGSSDTSSNYEATTSALDSDALKRIEVLENTVKDIWKKLNEDVEIPI